MYFILEQCKFFLFERKQMVLRFWLGRGGYLYLNVALHLYYRYFSKDYYSALSNLFRYERDVRALVGEDMLSPLYGKIRANFVQKYIYRVGKNEALLSFTTSQEAEDIRKQFSAFGKECQVRMRYPKKDNDPERQGDLMVLKPYMGDKEKGVLFIQYDEGVKRFASIFDIERLAEYYRFVIEPSTSGYQNAMYFLCAGLDTEVFIESQFEPDFDYIGSLRNNFVPVRLGAGDWADPELFSVETDAVKEYDVVMIANWLRWKRHELFFASLAKIRDSIKKVAVIGYAIDGRTLNNVKMESEKYQITDKIDFYERIPLRQVAEIIKKSKIGILLSKDEGANRAIYECFFSGVPVILSSVNRGVNRDHLNDSTGCLADDEQLPESIKNMVASYNTYEPRRWAKANTGYLNSTVKLNGIIQEIARKNNEEWTQDIYYKHNLPHARYKRPEELQQANEAVSHLYQFVKNTHNCNV